MILARRASVKKASSSLSAGLFPPRPLQVLSLKVRQRDRLIKVVALRQIAVHCFQQLELLPGLHPLRHDFDLQLPAGFNKIGYDDPGRGVCGQIVDQAFVQLYHVKVFKRSDAIRALEQGN